MRRKYLGFIVLAIAFLCFGCAPQRKGMRRASKRDCDCPSFSYQIFNASNVEMVEVQQTPLHEAG